MISNIHYRRDLFKLIPKQAGQTDNDYKNAALNEVSLQIPKMNKNTIVQAIKYTLREIDGGNHDHQDLNLLQDNQVFKNNIKILTGNLRTTLFHVDKTRGAIITLFSLCAHLAKLLEPAVTIGNDPTRGQKAQLIHNVLLHPTVSGRDLSDVLEKDKLIDAELNVMFTLNRDRCIRNLSLGNNSYLDHCHIELFDNKISNVYIGTEDNHAAKGYYFNSDLQVSLIRKLDTANCTAYVKNKIIDCFKNKSLILNLSNCDLTEVPAKEILSMFFPHLQILDLSHNKISKIPENAFAGLTSLQRLYLSYNKSYNKICKIKKQAFAGLTSLQVLDLHKSKIRKIKKQAFAGLISLHKLDLSYNKISQIQEQAFAGLISLHKLDLSYNKISQIQEQAFAGLISLQQLDLHSNKISQIQNQAFAELTSLQQLDLHSNEISEIQENAFAWLISLQKLNLACNEISQIQEQAFAGLTSLQQLDLHSNKISQIQKQAFAKLTSLHKLDLHSNKINQIQEQAFAGLTSLQQLTLFKNKISQIQNQAFAELTSLQELYLHNNEISQIQEQTFAKLTSLRKLDLSYNTISQIQEQAFAGLTSLQQLTLFNNTISQIQEQAFAGLTSLQQLDLHSNKISQIQKQAFAKLISLQQLNLHSNEISEIQEQAFAGLISLQELYLFNNTISQIQNQAFAGLTSLLMLDLSGNPIHVMQKDTLDELLYELYKISQNVAPEWTVKINNRKISVNQPVIIQKYIEPQVNNPVVQSLFRKYCLKLLLNNQLREPEAIRLLANEIHKGKISIEQIYPLKTLDWICELLNNHNLSILSFLVKNKDSGLKADELQAVIKSGYLIAPPSPANIQKVLKNKLCSIFIKMKADINRSLLLNVINIFTTGNGVAQHVDNQIKEEIKTIISKHKFNLTEEQINTIMTQVKATNSNRSGGIRNALANILPEDLENRDKAKQELTDKLAAIDKIAIQKDIVHKNYDSLGIITHNDLDYKELEVFCDWQSALSNYTSNHFKKLAHKTKGYIDKFNDQPEIYSSLIFSCSLYLTFGDIKGIISANSFIITEKTKEKLQVIINYGETYKIADEDPIKALFINENPQQVLLIEELSHLNPLSTERTLEKINLITLTASDPEKTSLNANNFKKIEARLPIWLVQNIKKQFTVANTIAKIVNKYFNEIIGGEKIELTEEMKHKLTDIFYTNARRLGGELGIPLENKKSIMSLLKDQQEDVDVDIVSNEDLISKQFARVAENCLSQYKKERGTFNVGNISKDELKTLPNKLIYELKPKPVDELNPKPYVTSIENLVKELELEFEGYETLNDVKQYGIYYLLAIYFANLASVNGLGYHINNDNKSFQRFRLYAAICLSQCVISAKNHLSDDQKLKMCTEIKQLLLASECAGQIANRLYGQYTSFGTLTKRIREILDTKMIT